MATEKEFVKKFAEQTGRTLIECKALIEEVSSAIIATAIEDGSCTFGKFGTFKYVDVPAKNGVINGKEWSNDARKKLTFKFSASGKKIGL